MDAKAEPVKGRFGILKLSPGTDSHKLTTPLQQRTLALSLRGHVHKCNAQSALPLFEERWIEPGSFDIATDPMDENVQAIGVQ